MFYNIIRKEPTESHRFLCHRVIKNEQLQLFLGKSNFNK
jgi:hypothetical protein